MVQNNDEDILLAEIAETFKRLTESFKDLSTGFKSITEAIKSIEIEDN